MTAFAATARFSVAGYSAGAEPVVVRLTVASFAMAGVWQKVKFRDLTPSLTRAPLRTPEVSGRVSRWEGRTDTIYRLLTDGMASTAPNPVLATEDGSGILTENGEYIET